MNERDITIEEVGGAFERLTYGLTGVGKADEARLHEWVNDIERIRFTLKPRNQMDAVSKVLQEAKHLFDETA